MKHLDFLILLLESRPFVLRHSAKQADPRDQRDVKVSGPRGPTPPLYSAARVLGRKEDYSGTPYSGRTIARGPCRPAFLVDKQAPEAAWRRAGDIGLSRPLA